MDDNKVSIEIASASFMSEGSNVKFNGEVDIDIEFNENQTQRSVNDTTNNETEHTKNKSEIFPGLDENLMQNIVMKALNRSKFITTRTGRFWIPTLETMFTDALQVIWRDNINVQKNMNKLIDEPNWQTNVRALVAIYCNVFLWIACWNMLTNNYNNHYRNYLYSSKYRYLIDLLYIFLGLLSMIFYGTLYQTAGYNGSWRNKTFFAKNVWWKAYVCLFGQFVFTIGIWDILYVVGYDTSDWTKNDPKSTKFILKDLFLYIAGYALIIITDSYWTNTCVMPPWYRPPLIQSDAPAFIHFKYTIYSILSLIGAACIWAGLYDFLLDYSYSNKWRELFYISTGLLIYIASGSFVANSLIWEGFDKHDLDFPGDIDKKINEEHTYTKTRTLSALYIIRAWLSLHGQIVHNAGAWMLFDLYIFPNHQFYRDIVFLILGIIGLAWSRALLLNASITPFSIPIQPDGLAMAYNSGGRRKKNKSKARDTNDIDFPRTFTEFMQQREKEKKEEQNHQKRSSAQF